MTTSSRLGTTYKVTALVQTCCDVLRSIDQQLGLADELKWLASRVGNDISVAYESEARDAVTVTIRPLDWPKIGSYLTVHMDRVLGIWHPRSGLMARRDVPAFRTGIVFKYHFSIASFSFITLTGNAGYLGKIVAETAKRMQLRAAAH